MPEEASRWSGRTADWLILTPTVEFKEKKKTNKRK